MSEKPLLVGLNHPPDSSCTIGRLCLYTHHHPAERGSNNLLLKGHGGQDAGVLPIVPPAVHELLKEGLASLDNPGRLRGELRAGRRGRSQQLVALEKEIVGKSGKYSLPLLQRGRKGARLQTRAIVRQLEPGCVEATIYRTILLSSYLISIISCLYTHID